MTSDPVSYTERIAHVEAFVEDLNQLAKKHNLFVCYAAESKELQIRKAIGNGTEAHHLSFDQEVGRYSCVVRTIIY